MKKLIKILYDTKHYKVHLEPNSNMQKVVISSDAGHAGHDDFKSQSGHIIYVAGVPILVNSSKQKLATLSATESELVALVHAMRDGVAMRELLDEMGYYVQHIDVQEDNAAVVRLVNSMKTPARTRHLSVKLAWLRDRAKDGFNIHYQKDPAADILTKKFSRREREELASKHLGLKRISFPGRSMRPILEGVERSHDESKEYDYHLIEKGCEKLSQVTGYSNQLVRNGRSREAEAG